MLSFPNVDHFTQKPILRPCPSRNSGSSSSSESEASLRVLRLGDATILPPSQPRSFNFQTVNLNAVPSSHDIQFQQNSYFPLKQQQLQQQAHQVPSATLSMYNGIQFPTTSAPSARFSPLDSRFANPNSTFNGQPQNINFNQNIQVPTQTQAPLHRPLSSQQLFSNVTSYQRPTLLRSHSLNAENHLSSSADPSFLHQNHSFSHQPSQLPSADFELQYQTQLQLAKKKTTGPVHNMKYKAKLCKNWRLKGICPYFEKCQFAHGDDELNKWALRRSRFINNSFNTNSNYSSSSFNNNNNNNNTGESFSSLNNNSNNNNGTGEKSVKEEVIEMFRNLKLKQPMNETEVALLMNLVNNSKIKLNNHNNNNNNNVEKGFSQTHNVFEDVENMSEKDMLLNYEALKMIQRAKVNRNNIHNNFFQTENFTNAEDLKLDFDFETVSNMTKSENLSSVKTDFSLNTVDSYLSNLTTPIKTTENKTNSFRFENFQNFNTFETEEYFEKPQKRKNSFFDLKLDLDFSFEENKENKNERKLEKNNTLLKSSTSTENSFSTLKGIEKLDNLERFNTLKNNERQEKDDFDLNFEKTFNCLKI